jgi:hypothetical protein
MRRRVEHTGGIGFSIETERGTVRQKQNWTDLDERVVVAEFGWWYQRIIPMKRVGRSNINVTDDCAPYNRAIGAANGGDATQAASVTCPQVVAEPQVTIFKKSYGRQTVRESLSFLWVRRQEDINASREQKN